MVMLIVVVVASSASTARPIGYLGDSDVRLEIDIRHCRQIKSSSCFDRIAQYFFAVSVSHRVDHPSL